MALFSWRIQAVLCLVFAIADCYTINQTQFTSVQDLKDALLKANINLAINDTEIPAGIQHATVRIGLVNILLEFPWPLNTSGSIHLMKNQTISIPDIQDFVLKFMQQVGINGTFPSLHLVGLGNFGFSIEKFAISLDKGNLSWIQMVCNVPGWDAFNKFQIKVVEPKLHIKLDFQSQAFSTRARGFITGSNDVRSWPHLPGLPVELIFPQNVTEFLEIRCADKNAIVHFTQLVSLLSIQIEGETLKAIRELSQSVKVPMLLLRVPAGLPTLSLERITATSTERFTVLGKVAISNATLDITEGRMSFSASIDICGQHLTVAMTETKSGQYMTFEIMKTGNYVNGSMLLGTFISCVEETKERQPDISFGHMNSSLADIQLPKLTINYALKPKVEAISVTMDLAFLTQWNVFSRASLSTKLLNSTIRIEATRTEGSFAVEVKAAVSGTIVLGTPILFEFPFVLSIPTSFKVVTLSLQDGKGFRADFGKLLELERLSGVFPQLLNSILKDVLITRLELKFPTSLNGSFEISNFQLHTLSNAALNFGLFSFEDLRVNYSYKETQIRGQVVFGNFTLACQMDWTPINQGQKIWLSTPVEMTDLLFFTKQIHKVFFGGKTLPLDLHRFGLSSIPNFSLTGMVFTLSTNLTVSNVFCKVYLPNFSWDLFSDFFSVDHVSLSIDVDIGSSFAVYVNGIVDLVEGRVKLPFELKIPSSPSETVEITLPKNRTVRASFSQLTGLLNTATSIQFPGIVESFLPEVLLEKLVFSLDHSLTSFKITEFEALSVQPWDLGGIGVLELDNITVRMDENSFQLKGFLLLGNTYLEFELANITLRPSFRLAKPKHAINLRRLIQDGLRKMIPSLTSAPDPDLLSMDMDNASLIPFAEVQFSNNLDSLIAFSLQVQLSTAWTFFKSCCTLRAPTMNLRVTDLNDVPTYYLTVTSSLELQGDSDSLVLPLECNIPASLLSTITLRLTEPVLFNLSKITVLPLVGKLIPPGLLSPISSVIGNVRLWPLVAHFQPQTAQMSALSVVVTAQKEWTFNGFPLTLRNISMELGFETSKDLEFHAALFGTFSFQNYHVSFQMPFPTTIPDLAEMNMDFGGMPDIDMSKIGQLLIGGFNLENLFPSVIANLKISLKHLQLHLLTPLQHFKLHGFRLRFSLNESITLIDNWLIIEDITADLNVTTAVQVKVSGTLSCLVILGTGSNVIQARGVVSMPSIPSQAWKLKLVLNQAKVLSLVNIMGLIGGGFDLRSVLPDNVVAIADKFVIRRLEASFAPKPGFEIFNITCTLMANSTDLLLPLRIKIQDILIKLSINNPFVAAKRTVSATIYVSVKLGEIVVPTALSVENEFVRLEIEDVKQRLSMKDLASLIGGDILLNAVPVPLKILNKVTLERLNITFKRPQLEVLAASFHCDLEGFDVGFSFPLPLGGPDNVFRARLELQHFTLTLNQNKDWELIGAIQASFTGIPQILEKNLKAIQGFLTVSARLVEFKIAKNLQDVSVSLNLAGINCNLNVKFYDPKISFRTPSVPEVGLTLAVTGFDALNTLLPFKVFEDKLEMVVSITEKKGLSIRLITFPILQKIIPCQKREEEYTCDFTWLCQSDSYLKFRLPSLGYTKDGFTAAIDVQGLDKLCLPLALPFMKDFFKNIPFLSNLFKSNIPLWPPPDIIEVFQSMGVNIENLPKGMARFRSPAFPREISVLLSVAGNGPLALSIEVQNSESLDIMLPAAFTSLAGVSLRRLSIGTTFGVPFIDVDVEVYLWQLHYLLLLSNLPKDNPMLINAKDMETHIICKDCFIVILGSIPVPVFAAPFHVEYATLVDARAHVTIYHRRPEFKDFGVLASFIGGLFKFFTDRNYLLSMSDFAAENSSLLVVKFSEGNRATMVQLPKFTGGTQLRLDIPPLDGRAFLIGWMNFFKTLEPGWLLKTIPLQYRLFDVAFNIGPFKWSLIRFAASSANELKQNKQMWPYAVKSSGDDALIIASANLPLLSANVELRVKNFGNAGLALGIDCGITQVVKISFDAQASIDLGDSSNPLTISSDAKLMLFDSLLLEGNVVVTKDKISIYGLLSFSFFDILQLSGEAQAVFGPGLSFVLDTGIDLRFIGVTLVNGHLYISDSPSKTFVGARALFMGSELNIELVRHGVAISMQAQVRISLHLRVDLGKVSLLGKDIGRLVLDTGFDCSLNIAFPGRSSIQASFHFMGVYINLPSLSFDTRDARPDRIPGLLLKFVKRVALSLIKDIFLKGPEILIRALIEGILDFAGDLGGLVKDFLETGFKLGAGLVKKVGEFLDKLADAREALTEVAQQAAKEITEAAKKVKEVAVKAAEAAKETAKKVFKEAEQFAKKLAVAGERLGHAVAKVIRYDSVVKEGKRILDNISNSLSKTVNRITDIVKKIAEDIARGLRDLAGKVVRFVSGWFGKRSIHRRDALLLEKELRTREKARLQREQSNQRSRVRSTERQLTKAIEEEHVVRIAHDAARNEAQRSAEKLKMAQEDEAEKLSLVEEIRSKGKCVTGENNCHPNATCLRTGADGQSFKCICRRGWIGDGVMCEEPIKSVVVMSDSPKAVGDVVSFASFSVSGTSVRFKYSFQEDYSKYGFSSYTFNSPGMYHIQVLAGNNVSNSTVSGIVIIQTPVSNVTLATSGDKRACRAVQLFPSANGTNVSFSIDFGDNTSSHNITSPLKHYFPHPGRFVINVTAINLVSFMSKTFVLEIPPSACDSVYCDIRALELSFPAKSLFEMASLSWHISQSLTTEMYHNRIWKFLAALLPLSTRELEDSGNRQWRVKREYSIGNQSVDIGFVLAGILSSHIQDLYSLNASLSYVPFIKEPLHTFTWLTAVLLSTEEFIGTWSMAKTSRELCQRRLPPSIINGAIDGFILGKLSANISQSEKLSDFIHDYYCPPKKRSLYSWQSRYTAFYNLSHILVDSGYFDSAILSRTLSNLSSNLDSFSSPIDYFCLNYWLENLMLELNKTGRFPQSKISSTVCSVYTKCSQCLSSGGKDGCFWCETSKTCLSNRLGAACNQSNAFYKNPCPENCNSNKMCTECVSDRGCGWCGSPFDDDSSFCAVGNPEGPRSTGMCDRLEWHYNACTKMCPLHSGQLCSGNGLCNSGQCYCFPGFYGSNCSKLGCVYSVSQNESILDISKWSKVTVASIKTENRIEINTLWLAVNTLLTLPTTNDKPYCLNNADLPKFDPLFPKHLRIANNKVNQESFCGIFGSLAPETDEGHTCNDIKSRDDCLRLDGCAWNVKDPCTGKVLEGCFKLTKWLDLIAYEGQTIFSPISGNIKLENNLTAITGWPRSEWEGYTVTVAHISHYNKTSVQKGQVIGTALQNKHLFLPVIIKVSVTFNGVYKNPLVHFIPCSPGCSQVLHRSNGMCDRACNTDECNYDYGECTSLYSTNSNFSLAPRSIHDYFSVTTLNVLHNLQRFTGERSLVASLEPISLYSLAKFIVSDVLGGSRLSSTLVYNNYKERIVKLITVMKSQNASMGRLTVSTVEKLIDMGLRKVTPYGRDGVDYDIAVIDASSVQNSTQFITALDMLMETGFLKYAFVENGTLSGISYYNLFITKAKTGNGLLCHYDPTVEIEPECDSFRTCSGHGVCLANGTCKCDSFYLGNNCQGNKCPNYCSDHGTCIDGVCACNTGWDGYDCSKVKLCSALCPENWIGDGICDLDCNIPKCYNDNGDCDHVCRCPAEWLSDGSCDQICNTTDCHHDGGDCVEEQCSPGCKSEMLADGICDHVCNTEQCDQDNGDCSVLGQCSCSRNIQGNGVCDDECNNPDCLYDYGDCTVQVTGTDCPVACSPPMIGNGFCDLSCNISACNLDGGDCKPLVSESTINVCFDGCLHIFRGDGVCDSVCNVLACDFDNGDCPKPIIQECFPDCRLDMVGDGVCQSKCQVEECSFDAEDCQCAPGCTNSSIGDGTCNTECFVESCGYDKVDCLCSSKICPESFISNGHCDLECNSRICSFDGGDCMCAPGCPLTSVNDGSCDLPCDTKQCDFDGLDCGGCDSELHSIMCDVNADCVVSNGLFPTVSCQCKPGYYGDGFSCSKRGNCFNSSDACSINGICRDLNGTFECYCNPGWVGNGIFCENVNECGDLRDNCSLHADCVDLPGSYKCVCKPGWTGDGYNCTDINECVVNQHSCCGNEDCLNTEGNFTCVCKPGWQSQNSSALRNISRERCDIPRSYFPYFTSLCVDVDECTEELHNCSKYENVPNSVCTNTVGGFRCSCLDGWQGDGYHCSDLNECLNSSVCGANQICRNMAGNFTCSCDTGWTPSTLGDNQCEDLNECTLGLDDCDTFATCINTNGSFTCECNHGFQDKKRFCTKYQCSNETFVNETRSHQQNATSSGRRKEVCSCVGEFSNSGRVCEDIDECQRKIFDCPPSAPVCQNLLGGYECICNADDNSTCDPVNPCDSSNNTCHQNMTCIAVGVEHYCVCPEGYSEDENGTGCVDINECMNMELYGACDVNSDCVNQDGSFECICRQGFFQSGDSCFEIDECKGTITQVVEGQIEECQAGICVSSQICAFRHNSSNDPGADGNSSLLCACDDNSNRDLDCVSATINVIETERNITTLVSIPWYLTENTTSNFTSINKTRFEHNCSERAVCKNTPGTYQCVCQEGFESNDGGKHCLDANECLSNNSCHANANCYNTFGSYSCKCKTGFTGNGLDNCIDEDECSLGIANCTHNSMCVNTAGGFFCGCVNGFHRNGTLLCEDVDECSRSDLNECHLRASCDNYVGAYNCSCKQGYIGNGFKCSDVDECRDDTISCGDHATCYNTLGSYICKCNPGWSGDGTNCSNIDECALGLHSCIEHSYCTDNQGSYTCSCYPGWKRQWFEPYGRCSKCDSDSLCSGHGQCLRNGTCNCLSYYGGSNCSICRPDIRCSGHGTCDFDGTCYCDYGWRRQMLDCSICVPERLCSGHGLCNYDLQTYSNQSCFCDETYFGTNCSNACPIIKGEVCGTHGFCNRDPVALYPCVCDVGYQWVNQRSACEDIDECLLHTHECVSPARCINEPGSYSCQCPSLTGWSFDGKHCNDTDECQYPNVCDAQATCINYPGSFNCSCNVGWRGQGEHPICHDIDECVEGVDKCPPPSQCINTLGSHLCECNQGWEKSSEFQCLDIDECSRGIHGCDPNSTCINTPGSWRCQCNNGWYPEPKEASLPTCKDVNECVEDQNACPAQSLCINSAGSYRCDCLAGWRNQGPHVCGDIDECSEGTYSCPSNSRCVNTAGSYQCHCDSGYEPPITTSTCQDIDECTRGTYSCPSNAYCVNTVGSYTCHCLQCYYMSGNTCHSDCRLGSETYYVYVTTVSYTSYTTSCGLFGWGRCSRTRTVYGRRLEARTRSRWFSNRPGATCPCL